MHAPPLSGNAAPRPWRIEAVPPREIAPGFRVWAVRATPWTGALDPYLACDVFEMAQPHFPPHPHAGFSAVTYMLPSSAGGFVNRDSRGDVSEILPGDVHWTEAAAGMMHEETPREPGVAARGLQLFVDLPAAHKLSEPRVYHCAAADVPTRRLADATVRVVCDGGVLGGAAVVPRTKCLLLDIEIPPDGIAVLPVPQGWTVFGLRLEGALVGEDAALARAPVALLASMPVGDRLVLEASARGARVVVLGGPPLAQPLAFGGPFVMSTPDQLRDARLRFAAGGMGHLAPSF